jgi:hypothetical protein
LQSLNVRRTHSKLEESRFPRNHYVTLHLASVNPPLREILAMTLERLLVRTKLVAGECIVLGIAATPRDEKYWSCRFALDQWGHNGFSFLSPADSFLSVRGSGRDEETSGERVLC